MSFGSTFGVEPDTSQARDRNDWKARLTDALIAVDEIVTQGGAEFAEEIFGSMDLYRAARAVPTIGSFVDELRGTLRRLASGS